MRNAAKFASILPVLLIDSAGFSGQGSAPPAQPLPLPARISLLYGVPTLIVDGSPFLVQGAQCDVWRSTRQDTKVLAFFDGYQAMWRRPFQPGPVVKTGTATRSLRFCIPRLVHPASGIPSPQTGGEPVQFQCVRQGDGVDGRCDLPAIRARLHALSAEKVPEDGAAGSLLLMRAADRRCARMILRPWKRSGG